MRRATSSMRVPALLLAALGLFALTPVAGAAQITLPPGASEGDQYFEVVPTGGGNASIDRGAGEAGGGGGGGGGGSPVAAAPELNALGPDGKAAADIARDTQPPASGAASTPPSAEPPSSESMGILLPIILAATLLAAVAYGRHRHIIGS